ncbi:hypothetical protein [Jiulongibacter sediminis]|uniref:Uncharacterized protein n=1 Tax=Jiulongibacter sediminis TaxID=1605367 RepID=A0A0P7BZH0_9BACT|nr:hypothetical protein [Jiulongibacter sediminis]KPM47042.1 hypothetical protein AFM12_17620 [Jiulongibacter sediminis]TBX22385.1 hypothetical protein TK44_17625 [Jiulongibacter sediminis]
MKKIIVTALVAVAVNLTSCDQNEVSPASTLTEAFDMATAGGGQPGSERPGPGGMEGQRPEITEVAVEELSSSITEYINANYAGATIDRAGTDPEGNFLLGISLSDEGHRGLLFDASGNFVEEKQKPEGKGPGDKMGQRPELTELDISALSATISDYISANYADFSIEKAGTDPEGNTMVLVSNGDTKTGLLFNAEGGFEKELPPPPHRPEGQPEAGQ